MAVYRNDAVDVVDVPEDFDPNVSQIAYVTIRDEGLMFLGDMEHQPATMTLLEELTRLQRHYFNVGDFCSEEDARRAEQGGWPSP